jgi:drug/metabolite transporter (DMT)-like permease
LPHPDDVLTTASVQMLVAGLLLTGAALVTGEPFDVQSWSVESWAGLLYLVVPGSLLAYASLLWLLANVPVWLATSYAYVNPVVALLLGWAILRERLDLTTVFGSVLVIVSVAFVDQRDRGGRAPEEQASARWFQVKATGFEEWQKFVLGGGTVDA